ncbi:aldo/keto reductase [Streptomyces cocklensis]|jgi:D-threo-aldose 1-dehydrogenase|uniref:D-threo-aldose 1-dehydrogenase n=1 Tax=Actinacidiphila cocklensis TaxID=887465 RepID=A0A9W4DV94_9ACTN|nr:aldo/keto reductase [Actinacidiphila cocklensis]MDD1060809.1 aldo/keto reductase [Actinacidiphila cocklensis]WSX73675.1 aldo/keto reductase [Streptomyces sp. NBC_00899]WSX80262.1 aldo/keto reductase [Streptomyces sp. NBC_00899]CAG6396813.1 D-threo-aldose 1-dehydrogenase [Actinacidiphila cocklensis]
MPVPALPRLGLGCAPLANLYRAITEEEAEATVAAAFDAGRPVTYLDTAPHYGLGRSEERLGRALAGRDRASYVLSTKVGRRLRDLEPGETPDGQGFTDVPDRARVWDFTADGIRATLEGSLTRLGVDAVDIVYLHDVEDHLPEVYATGFPALAELRDQGMVKAIGFGMNHSDVLARLVADLDVDVVLCAGRWTLLERTAYDDLLPVCERRGTKVVVGGVYNSGLLADPRPGAHYDYAAAPQELLDRALDMAAVCGEFGVPLRAAALRYPFAHPSVVSALVGAASAAEVRDNTAMFDHDIPDAMWHALVERGLLDPDVPLPLAASLAAGE